MLLFALIVEFFSSRAFIISQLLRRLPLHLHPETSREAIWARRLTLLIENRSVRLY